MTDPRHDPEHLAQLLGGDRLAALSDETLKALTVSVLRELARRGFYVARKVTTQNLAVAPVEFVGPQEEPPWLTTFADVDSALSQREPCPWSRSHWIERARFTAASDIRQCPTCGRDVRAVSLSPLQLERWYLPCTGCLGSTVSHICGAQPDALDPR